jgi:cysteine desulfurase
MKRYFGNPSSLYRLGMEAENIVSAARRVLAKALGCEEQCLFFTGSATESNNIAIFGSLAANPRKGKKILTTAVEHAAVLGPFTELQKRGYETVYLLPDETGNYTAQQFFDAVDDHTALVSVMLVNNEVGTRHPVEEIIRAVRRKNPNTLIHIDAVQGAFKLPFSIRTAAPDLLSVSGHKIYAPKGVGALYIKKGVKVSPLFFGGGQEKGMRPGTESVPLIAAFAAAVEWYLPQQKELLAGYEALRTELLERLAEIPEISVNSPVGAVPYITNLSVQGIRSEIMLHFLESRGVFVSSGSACAKGAKSHVLDALGLSDGRADTALRVSFGAYTEQKDIDRLVDGLKEGLASLIRTK